MFSVPLHRGLNPVSDEEVIAMYEGSHVPLEIMSDFYGKVLLTSCAGGGGVSGREEQL